MSGQVDASADAGAATCHNEDMIKMFQPNKQHVEEKGKKIYPVEICKHLENILHIGYARMFD